MSPEHAPRTVPAGTAPAGTTPHPALASARSIAQRIAYHHAAPGDTPEERYLAATGRWPNDD